MAGDSYTSTVGIEAGTNQPGEKRNVGKIVGEKAGGGCYSGESEVKGGARGLRVES